jgi:chromosome segregation ATPase
LTTQVADMATRCDHALADNQYLHDALDDMTEKRNNAETACKRMSESNYDLNESLVDALRERDRAISETQRLRTELAIAKTAHDDAELRSMELADKNEELSKKLSAIHAALGPLAPKEEVKATAMASEPKTAQEEPQTISQPEPLPQPRDPVTQQWQSPKADTPQEDVSTPHTGTDPYWR